MKTEIVGRLRAQLDRLHHLGPVLVVALAALLAAACNNGSGGSGY